LTVPVRISAMAWPPAWPGYQAWTMACTLSRQGMATGLPVSPGVDADGEHRAQDAPLTLL
jgi:hypothetical protein